MAVPRMLAWGYRAARPRRGEEPQGRLVHSGNGSDKGIVVFGFFMF